MNETNKRLRILKGLFTKFDKNIFEGILLVGSMSYGKYICVNKKSDIDLVFIINKNNLKKFLVQNFFTSAQYFDEERINLLENGKTDGFWIDQYINGVFINIGIYNKKSVEEYAYLSKKKWKISTQNSNEWDENIKYKGTDGKLYKNRADIKRNKKWYIKSYNVYIGKTFISNVFSSNLLTANILYDKNNFAKKNIIKLKRGLLNKYGLRGVMNILEFVLNKIPANYDEKLMKKIKRL